MVIPEASRTEPARVAGEREMLESWLDYHRATLLRKCSGLADERLKARSCPPSPLSLLGLVRHMTDVENGWFSDFRGHWQPRYSTSADPDADFEGVDAADAAENVRVYEDECERSRAMVAERGLDETYTDERGRTFSLRWIYLHMIEEYARHNGHADLLRERIDGAVGV
jgi:uncharacterized damage-inducible protein DinB